MASKDTSLGHDEIYNIQQPYKDGRIIVYGERDMGWYEYALVDSNGCTESRTDKGYGSAEIALRDALIEASA